MDNKARVIEEVATQLGWNEDITQLIQRVNQLDKGLVQEDEFIYIINWLGKCKLIHKLDQLQLPQESKSEYVIPDILVEVETNEGNRTLLIEIKTSQKEKLSWTETYYQGLINYGKLLGIPVLIAWKWNLFDTWTLFEMKHFSKPVSNYKISFETANKENLLSKLFGDFIVIPYDDFGLNISMKKIEKISQTEKENGNLEIGWQTIFEEIYFSGKDNKKVPILNTSVLALVTSLRTKEIITENDTHIITKFVPDPNKMQFAQTIPIRLTQAFSSETVNWLQASKENKKPIEYKELLEGLDSSIKDDLVQFILFTIPASEK